MGSDVRLGFKVGEPGRFISHLDILRMMERAIRRARLPIAYSEGFSPKPKMVFASALPVGITSDAEYVDLKMEREITAAEVVGALNQELPSGFRVFAGVDLPEQYQALMAIITTAQYQFQPQRELENLDQKIKRLLDQDQLMITVTRKRKVDKRNIRGLIDHLSLNEENNRINLQCKSGLQGNLRPMDLLPFLEIANQDVLIHRTALLVKANQDKLLTPFEVLKE